MVIFSWDTGEDVWWRHVSMKLKPLMGGSDRQDMVFFGDQKMKSSKLTKIAYIIHFWFQ